MFKLVNRCAFLFLILLVVPKFALAQLTVPPGGAFTVPPDSTVDLACTNLNVLGSFALGSGQVADASGVQIAAGGSVSGGSGTLFVSGDWSNAGTFTPDASSVVFNDACTSSPITISGISIFNNLTLTSSSGGTFVLPEGSNITVNGTLTLLGAVGQPIQLVSSGSGTAIINLGAGAQVVQNNATIAGNVRIGSPVASIANIPTLSEWSMILLALAMGLIAFTRRRNLAI